MNIQLINPINYKGWDEILLTNDQSTFFHTSAWARVLSESYYYKPLYFSIIEEGNLLALVPIMAVNSFLTGKRGVSLPFSDYCRSIIQNSDQYNYLLQHIFKYGKMAGWKYIELRGGQMGLSHSRIYVYHFSHTCELNPDDSKVFSCFKSNVKRNIKKSQKESVQIEITSSWESMKVFCELNILTRKQHGLPPQPLFFFRNIFKHVISPGKGFVTLALWKDTPVAAAVFFHFGKKAIYKYGASDGKYQKLRPNNLVMWEAIKWYCHNGCKTFNFGRTEPENHGLLQFKRGWGVKEEIINYYKYDLKRDSFISNGARTKPSYNFFKHLPIPLLQLTGNLFYRHVG
jgi:hypothetical protein